MAKKINYGKKFEQAFKESSKGLKDIIVERIPDQVSMKRNSKNVCDFLCYKHPNIFYIELKSTKGKTFPLSRISQHQWEQMMLRQKVNGVKCGILLNFRPLDTLEECWYVSLSELNEVIMEGKKSVKLDEVKQIGIELKGTLKKVNYHYDMEDFFTKLQAESDNDV
jgi:penicillin-binding protein-related factor A (putative recombinase)